MSVGDRIDVYEVECSGNRYLDTNIVSIIVQISESHAGDTFRITKHKISKEEYDSLPSVDSDPKQFSALEKAKDLLHILSTNEDISSSANADPIRSSYLNAIVELLNSVEEVPTVLPCVNCTRNYSTCPIVQNEGTLNCTRYKEKGRLC